MSKRQVTGQAEQNVETDRENTKDGNFLQQVRIVGTDWLKDNR